MAEEQYTWTDNPTESGKSICDTDILNECLMHLKYDNKGGSGYEVCDIGMALYVDETKGLRRYLNGQIVDINTNTQAFLNRLKDITTLHPSLLCTEDEWYTAKTLSPFAQVGKFVFNYADDGETVVSVRIPAIVNVQGLFDLSKLGMTVGAGLPNVSTSGNYDRGNYWTGYGTVIENGPFKMTASKNYHSSVGADSGTSVLKDRYMDKSFDLSRANPIYGNSDTVQPEAIQYPYFIQIATGSETENNIINDIELNNPYSLFDSKYSDHELNNLSWLKSVGQWNTKSVYPTAYDKLLKIYNGAETVEGLSVKLSTEEYTDYDFVLNTADETFRLPLKTKLASGKAVVGNGMALGLINGSVEASLGYATTTYKRLFASATIGANIGETVANGVSQGDQTAFGVTTDPTKSGIELSDSGLYLYFYVGETVQNANLIDAGRIGEILPTKTDKVQAARASMPSDKYIDLTLGESGSTYTAPADGWYCFGCPATASGQFVQIVNTTVPKFYTNNHASKANSNIAVFLPANKNDVIQVNYDTASSNVFRFYYAEGSKEV